MGFNKLKESGISLIEVLISVLVIAVGLLGIAGLQLSIIKANHSAELRALAISQVNNIIDRMQANYEGVEAGHYDNASGTPSKPSCTTCTVSETATKDINEWNTTNSFLLPNGQGTVSKNGDTHTVTLFWDNERTGATGLNCSGDSEVDLTCLRFEVKL